MAYTIIPPDGRGDSVGITLLFFSAFSLLLAIVAIALRLWVRHIKSTPLALNDWLLFVGWVFSLGLTIIIVIFVTIGGLGQDQKNVSKESITLTLQLLPAAETLWAAANTAVKVSILLVYKDIFALRSFRRAADTAIVVVIMLGVGNTIQCLAICRPFSFQWDKTIEGGKCGNQNLGILLVAFLNLVTDLIIVIMPMPLVWNLKMPRHKRLALIGIFSLGIIICVMTALRIVFTFSLIRNPHNSTFWIAVNAIFLTLEPNLGIVNGCLLLLKPILERVRPKLSWATYSNDHSSADYPLSAYGRDKLTTNRNFKRLGDDLEAVGVDNGLDCRLAENSKDHDSARENRGGIGFANQRPEVSVGQRDLEVVPKRGITVTKTIDLTTRSRN